MKPVQDRYLYNLTRYGKFDRARFWTILRQGEVSARGIVVAIDVLPQNLAEMLFIQNDHAIGAFASN